MKMAKMGMPENSFRACIFLALELGAALLIGRVLNAFVPELILPLLDIPAMTLLSLTALLLDMLIPKVIMEGSVYVLLFGCACFGILPWVAGMTAGWAALRYAVAGGAVFALTHFILRSAQERISSGGGGKCALLLNALILFLISLGFTGMLK